jgi:SNF2 family DNA or RNA helicase
MNDNVRQIQIEKFRKSSHGSVFLLSSKAGGTGLNLTVANKMIMM